MRRMVSCIVVFAVACAPAPVSMPADQARQVIEQFSGGVQRFDVCTPEGRAILRGAVRSFSSAEAAEGRVWPTVPVGDERAPLDAVNGSVLVAVAAGFVKVNDLRGDARAQYRMLALEHWLHMRDARLATELACEDVLRLQQVGAQLVVQMQRLERMRESRIVSQTRIARQIARVSALEEELRAISRRIQARLEEHRGRLRD